MNAASNMPLVSVIVPMYGVQDYIRRCAESLFAQTYPAIEFIFVDDGSPDRSVEILEDLIRSEFPSLQDRVKILRKENGGLPQARLTVCCDLTKLHEKTLRGIPEDVLRELKANEKTEKGEYCVVLDLHGVSLPEPETETAEWPLEAKLIEEMKQGKTLREAQDALAEAGEKKNAVKQAALTLKKLFK